MHKQPKVMLSGIEFLCLSIQANPGKSQRFHLKRLQRYKTGKDCPGKGNRGSGYFRSPYYRNILWTDHASKNLYIGRGKWRATSSKMYISGPGNERANEARQKLGLAPIEYIPHIELV